MKKSELLELLKDISNDGDVNKTILQQEDFAKSSIETIDDFNTLLASNKEIQGFVDSKMTGAIESFKTKGMVKILDAKVQEAVKKATGKDETEEQIAIRQLQEKLSTMEKEKSKAEMTSKFKDVLGDKKIPSKLIDFLIAEDEDVTNANISLFEESIKNYVEDTVKTRLGDSSYTPPKNDTKQKLTIEDFKGMTPDEINKHWDSIEK